MREVAVLEHLIGTAIIAGIAYLIRRANAGKSTRDWFIGWVVFVPCIGGYFAAGVAQLAMAPAITPAYVVGTGMFGFLVGLVSSNILGRLIWRYYQREIEGDPDAQPVEVEDR